MSAYSKRFKMTLRLTRRKKFKCDPLPYSLGKGRVTCVICGKKLSRKKAVWDDPRKDTWRHKNCKPGSKSWMRHMKHDPGWIHFKRGQEAKERIRREREEERREQRFARRMAADVVNVF